MQENSIKAKQGNWVKTSSLRQRTSSGDPTANLIYALARVKSGIRWNLYAGQMEFPQLKTRKRRGQVSESFSVGRTRRIKRSVSRK